MFEKLRKALKSFVDRAATRELSPKTVEALEDELIFQLVESDVALEVAEGIISELKRRIEGVRISIREDKRRAVESLLKEVILDIFRSAGKLDLLNEIRDKAVKNEPYIIVFLGPNGHGKTTTIAKIARLLLINDFRVVVAASDTFRAGAIEQLEEHCNRLGVKLVKHRYGADPAAVAFDAVAHARSRRFNVVLIDTAGRMQTDRDLMDEMRKIVRVVSPDAKIFVGDALTGNDALYEAKRFHEEIGIDGSILTKADADVKGGAAISIVYATRRPILYLGTGQSYDDLVEFDPKWFVEKLFG